MSTQALLEGLLELMLPRETVAGALRRLGARGGGKEGSKGPGRPSSPQRLDRLSGLADQMVAQGNLGVYQETRVLPPLQLLVHVVIYASGQSGIDQKFQLPAPWVGLICFSHSHKTQRHILFTRLSVDYKRYSSGTASCKRGLGQVMMKEFGASMSL